MPDQVSYDYAIIRVVPRVDRQEFVNVGIIVFSRELNYLAVRFDLGLERLKTFSPQLDLGEVRRHLTAIADICGGHPSVGYYSQLSKSERFNWLVAPASHMIQASPVHSGIFPGDGDKVLDELFALLVA